MPDTEPSLTPHFFREWHLVRELVKYNTPLHEIARLFTQGYALAALEMERGNRTRAAARLGIHRNSLNRWIGGLVPKGRAKGRPEQWSKLRGAHR